MLSREQQPHPRGDNREGIIRAHQAAEALFKPKPSVSIPPVSEAAPGAQAARKPRVLQIVSPATERRPEPENPVRPAPPPPEIPRSQFARIRTWVKYGMTVAQVAQVYGVADGEIERILGREIRGG